MTEGQFNEIKAIVEKIATEQYKAISTMLVQIIAGNLKNDATINTVLMLLAEQKAKNESKTTEETWKDIQGVVLKNQAEAAKATQDMMKKLFPDIGSL